MKYFEDIQIGDKITLDRHTFTADEIKAFAQRFDPQPFHLDEKAAERSHFGALCASGWHTAAVWMRMLVDAKRRASEAISTSSALPAHSCASACAPSREHRCARTVYKSDW